jgi:hypothetical protein
LINYRKKTNPVVPWANHVEHKTADQDTSPVTSSFAYSKVYIYCFIFRSVLFLFKNKINRKRRNQPNISHLLLLFLCFRQKQYLKSASFVGLILLSVAEIAISVIVLLRNQKEEEKLLFTSSPTTLVSGTISTTEMPSIFIANENNSVAHGLL